MDPVSAAIAGGLSLIGGVHANNNNLKIAREQMRFQERMSNTAVQRHADDLEKAGFNRLLAAGGTGASTPAGSSATMQNPVDIKPFQILGIQKARADIAKTRAETDVALKNADNLKEQNRILTLNFEKLQHDLDIIKGTPGMPSNTPWLPRWLGSKHKEVKASYDEWLSNYKYLRSRGYNVAQASGLVPID